MARPITYTTNHKYHIVAYSPAWPGWFVREEKVLKGIFGEKALGIDHVGSTAVPGMAAKPQLDILVQMHDMDDTDTFNEALAAAGYVAYGDALKKGGRLFSRWENGEKVVNLHVYQPESRAVGEYIKVRDYLISHPEEARAYAALKLELYEKYPDDYLKYREYKDPYIDVMKERIQPTPDPFGILRHDNAPGRRTDYLYRISLKGLLRNEKGEVLVVKETGRDWWDLPGGGMDHGEDIKTALAREMKEEVNLEGDFSYRIIDVDEPALLAPHNFWQLRLIFEITPATATFSPGDDGDEVAFMDPASFKDSESAAERRVYRYGRLAAKQS